MAEREELIQALRSLGAEERAAKDHLQALQNQTLVVLFACRQHRIPGSILAEAFGLPWQALRMRIQRAREADPTLDAEVEEQLLDSKTPEVQD